METPSNLFTSSAVEDSGDSYKSKYHSLYPDTYGFLPSGRPPRPRLSSTTATWITETTKSPYVPYGDHYETSISYTTPTLIVTNKVSSSTASPTNGFGSQHSGGHWPKKHTTLYAAASIVPIIVLAIVAGLVFFCMRKRRRQRHAAAASQMAAQEMKMQPQRSAQPYVASLSPAILPQYSASPEHSPTSTSPSAPPPVILGPIPSGSNGTYLTGIDTSDVVSVTSNNNRQADPFADSNLAEPPPPYRPRSVAPPSFVSASRQSSFRVPDSLPATSQTHLIERSPFEDPRDDDAISDLSGPTVGRAEDAMSAVSDLSYQHDAVVGRSSL
ncbi:hypothetical protein BKA66DRAFT_47428 [Pyrenochaeta sp. MPI-SDFR-AT-0127]|nr:hypothetical protein BKA66DRAFT_47428 [Pyrenochaeta sp. MPI-SDFR-AT-0127]